MSHGSAIIQTEVRSDGILGKLYRPADNRVHAGVVVLGGSGGALGWSADMAANLASHDCAALAIADGKRR